MHIRHQRIGYLPYEYQEQPEYGKKMRRFLTRFDREEYDVKDTLSLED